MTLHQLQQWVRGSWAGNTKHKPTVETQILYIIEELGEVAEAIRKNKGLKDRTVTSVDLGSEFADLIISIVTLANSYDIDLTTEIDKFKQRLSERENNAISSSISK